MPEKWAFAPGPPGGLKYDIWQSDVTFLRYGGESEDKRLAFLSYNSLIRK